MKSGKEEHEIVPGQTKGQQSSAHVEIELSTREEAVAIFEKARLRLMNVDSWEKYGGNASFLLVNYAGEPVNRLARTGDYIRINLPGPGSSTGDGYDWVCIEDMTDEENEKKDETSFAFRVRPASNPTNSEDKEAHFFTGAATSSFIVQRKGKILIAEEQGRNEVPNVHTGKTLDNVRNAMVAVAASNGMAHMQWKSLMKGILGLGI